MASTDAWVGSTIDDADVRRLRLGRFLGKEDEVGARAPDPEEILPNPEKGKVVVFNAHLERGLALPVSTFFTDFLRFYGLQPHHLGANCLTQLSCFVTLYEAYLGIWPSVEVWRMFFFL